jgi:hypothetical protein
VIRRRLYKCVFIDGEAVYVTDPRHPMHEQAKRERAAYDKAQAAAERLNTALEEAREGGYIVNAWYSYMNRRDLEIVLEALLG